MRTLLAIGLWLGAATAQSDHVSALRERDWRVRNEAAVILAALPDAEFDIDALIDVLRAPWDGPEIIGARFGGRAARPPGDPLTRVLTSAADAVAGRKIVGGVSGQKLASVDQLVVPWHPHELAAFLLRARPAMLPRVAAALRAVPLTTPELVAVWLAAATPDLDALQRRAEDGSDLGKLAQQIWSDEAHRRSLLPALVAEGAPAWRRAVLDLGDAAVLATPEAQQAAVAHFLTGEDPSARKQAGFVLTQLGAKAVPLVVQELRQSEHAEAVLALLCTLGEQAEGVGGELLPFLTGRSRVEKQRALAVIARAPIAATSRAALAEAAFAILQEGPTLSMRILAIDALANLGDGVDSAMREELLRCVDEPSGDGKRVRVLGCLWRLKVPVDLAPERKVRICTMVFASDDTWLAAADEGASAMPDLAKLLSADEHARRRGLVGERLAQVAPRELATWLDHADAGIRSLAIRCLRTCDPDVVPTARIVPLLADAKTWVARAALEWIADRADVVAHREPVLAAVAAVDDRWAKDFVPALFARLGLTTADRLAVLADKLRQGLRWELVRDGEAAVLREALLRWYRETTEPAERAGLVAELVRLGLRDDEIALVREALRGPNASRLGSALREAESLPASLRGDLEAVLDRALASKDLELAWLADDVRTALLAHYRR